MLLVRVDPRKPAIPAIRKAAAVLKAGGLVVYPTETAYALGCDAADAGAVRKIFAVKRRDASKPLPLIAASMTKISGIAQLSKFERALARAFWPGPLTLVLPFRRRFAPGVASKRGDLALRLSPHPVASALARGLGRPVVSTSANLSGRGTPYRVADVLADLGTLPDLVLDAGALPHTPPSTVVRCGTDRCEILREGPVTAESLRRTLEACR
jgi:L-threonylcarbamoyladenylate synthase